MKTKTIIFSLMLILFSFSNSVWAIPYLQLDIEDGTYIGGEDETVHAQSNVFTMYGLVDSKKGPVDDVFYISAALVSDLLEPIGENEGGNFGHFSFDGNEYNVTSDMIYGTPPTEAAKNNSLPTHGIFPTFFKEFSFTTFDGRANEYNVEDDWGGISGGLTPNINGPLYYAMFSVDTSGLDAGYAIHFDLYTKTPEGTLSEFAPFSHDAQSGPPVPEPATMLLFGTGLAGLVVGKRKRLRRQN